MQESAFRQLYLHVISLLEQLQQQYLVVGGVATGVLGEPRLTHDVDVIVGIKPKALGRLLKKAKEEGFYFDISRAREEARERGTFRMQFLNSWADFIIASTDLEQAAFRRAGRTSVLGVEANFPSPEDFILFKLIPGRPKDLLDAESVILRHRDLLDRGYLEGWARRISDEMEDLRVFNTLRKLLGGSPSR